MKIQTSSKLPIILTLLSAEVIVNLLSLFFFLQLDHIVNTDLYRYGLQFNYEWAGQYSMYSGLILSSFVITLSIAAVSVLSVVVNARTHGASSRFVCYLFLLVGTVTSIFSALLLTRLDYMVHNDLYRYGLQFSYEWAMQYWTYARLLLVSIGVSSLITLVSFMLFFVSAHAITRINQTKLISSVLITTGTAALILSIYYTSSILAFIGLGLVFWGIIFTYIRPEEYTKRTLLDATVSPLLATLDQIMQETSYEGKAVFLPPKYFPNPGTNKVYIPKQKDTKLPTPEQIQTQEAQFIIENPQGFLLTPPGAELVKLFEKTLKTSFARVDLQYLQQNMPKLFIETLEIAKNFEMETVNSRVHVKIENSVYQNLALEAMHLELYGTIGCPLNSAIACALAKAVGKPIIIENQKTSGDGKKTEIEYRILEEEETEQ